MMRTMLASALLATVLIPVPVQTSKAENAGSCSKKSGKCVDARAKPVQPQQEFVKAFVALPLFGALFETIQRAKMQDRIDRAKREREERQRAEREENDRRQQQGTRRGPH